MTQDTKIILRELAIIQANQQVLLDQNEALANRVFSPADRANFPKGVSEVQIEETVGQIKQRLATRHNLLQQDF
jgi:hypothetical protein